jgi:hypothetical protein
MRYERTLSLNRTLRPRETNGSIDHSTSVRSGSSSSAYKRVRTRSYSSSSCTSSSSHLYHPRPPLFTNLPLPLRSNPLHIPTNGTGPTSHCYGSPLLKPDIHQPSHPPITAVNCHRTLSPPRPYRAPTVPNEAPLRVAHPERSHQHRPPPVSKYPSTPDLTTTSSPVPVRYPASASSSTSILPTTSTRSTRTRIRIGARRIAPDRSMIQYSTSTSPSTSSITPTPPSTSLPSTRTHMPGIPRRGSNMPSSSRRRKVNKTSSDPSPEPARTLPWPVTARSNPDPMTSGSPSTAQPVGPSPDSMDVEGAPAQRRSLNQPNPSDAELDQDPVPAKRQRMSTDGTAMPSARPAHLQAHSPSEATAADPSNTPGPLAQPLTPGEPAIRSALRHYRSIPIRTRRRNPTPDPLPEDIHLGQPPARRWRRTGRQHDWQASHKPPINVSHLIDIDVDKVISHSQARHDLLFHDIVSNFAEAPASVYITPDGSITTGPVYLVQTEEGIVPSRHSNIFPSNPPHGPIVMQPAGMIPSKPVPDYSSCETHMFWETVGHEVVSGCRCLRWVVNFEADMAEKAYISVQSADKEDTSACYCGKWLADASESAWERVHMQGPYPSRLVPVLQELRDMIKLLMGNTEPRPLGPHAQSHVWSNSLRAERQAQTRVVVFNLLDRLDPAQLARELRHGAFDVSIFGEIARTMKIHCAPMRDAKVDSMVQLAEQGDIGAAIRRCFECCRYMKIDIVNHEVYGLRRWLEQNASLYERGKFERTLRRDQLSYLEQSATQEWLHSASRRVLETAKPEEVPHLEGRCTCNKRSDLVFKSFVEGLCTLMFAEWTGRDKCAWKVASGTVASDPTPYKMPESIRMDVSRLWQFS